MAVECGGVRTIDDEHEAYEDECDSFGHLGQARFLGRQCS